MYDFTRSHHEPRNRPAAHGWSRQLHLASAEAEGDHGAWRRRGHPTDLPASGPIARRASG